jgi:hypothetical protein
MLKDKALRMGLIMLGKKDTYQISLNINTLHRC